jgi:CDP-diglyceride synthetase
VRERLGGDFVTRLASSLAMGAVAALFTFTGMTAFAVLVVAVTMVLSWEWGRLVHGREADLVIAVHMGAVGVAGVLAAVGFVGLGLLALPIGAILATLLSLGRNSLFSALGVFYAGLPAVALIWLRSDATLGLLAVIFIIIVVIASDTAGFLSGRLLGGPKLWPRVSPNKTWAGFIGALVASSIVGALFWLAVPVLPSCGWRRRVLCCHSWLRLAIRRIGHQTPVRRQGFEHAHPGPWRRDGPRRRPCRGSDGGRAGQLRHQCALARACALARVLRD